MTVNGWPAQSLGSDGREILLGGLRAVTDPPLALLPLGPFDFVLLAPDTDRVELRKELGKTGIAAILGSPPHFHRYLSPRAHRMSTTLSLCASGPASSVLGNATWWSACPG